MPAQLPIDDTLGAAFVGLVLSSILLGVSFLQVYVYFSEESETDHNFLKLFVASLLACNTLHNALASHFVYFYTVTNYGDYDSLRSNVWSLELQFSIAGLLAFMVQSFYAWRIYTLSGNKNCWLPCLVALCSLGSLITAIGATVSGFMNHVDISWTDVSWSSAGLSIEIIGNVLITSGMIYYVWTTVETRRLVYSVVMYGFNSGLLSTILSVVLLVTSLTHKQNLIPIPFLFILARVYVCSCLSTLNMHEALQSSPENSGPSILTRPSFLTTMASEDQLTTNNLENHAEVYVAATKESL